MNEVDFYLFDLKSKFNKITPKKYYLSYSGGKDSHLLYWFIEERKRQKKIWYKIKRKLKKLLKRERGTNEDI